MKIPERPDIPDGLREAAARGTLVPFIGAGASRIAGSPGWEDFADQVLRQLVDGGGLSYRQMDQLKRESARVKLSIAENVSTKTGIKIDYKRVLHPPLADELKARQLYSAISRFSKVFITTNYDDWLDRDWGNSDKLSDNDASAKARKLEKEVFYRPERFLVSNLSPSNTGSVFHIHGSIKDPSSMVLTTNDYLERYASSQNVNAADERKEENRLLTLLDFIFRERTVLFIGYSLSELEMLEYAILKSKESVSYNTSNGGVIKHYMLSGFFTHEADLASSLSEYWFKNASTALLPYSRDDRNWDQLIDVCDHLANELVGLPGVDALERKRTMEALLRD